VPEFFLAVAGGRQQDGGASRQRDAAEHDLS
jgi:hypothetical protein